MYTDQGQGVKWNLINRIGSDTLLKTDSEVEANALLSRCTDLVGKIATHKITIKEIVTIIVLNQLPSQFDNIKEIKRNEAKSTNSVSKLNANVEVIKDNIRNRYQSSVVANFIVQKDRGKGKGNNKAKGRGNNTRLVCFFKPYSRKGYAIDNCALAHPERVNKIFAEVKKKKEEKAEKEKNKDNKKKGAYDVYIITALNVAISNKSVSSTPKPSIKELRCIVDQLKNMVKNTVTVNRVVTYSPVWYIIIDSGAQRIIFSNRELLHDFIKAEDYIKTGSGEVFKSPGYSTVIFELDSPNGIVPWRIHNAIWCPDLDYNLIGTLPLARNNIEVQLKPIGHPSKLLADSECFGYADIMNDQYIVRGRCIEKDTIHALYLKASIDINIIITPEQLYRRIGYLNYNSVMQISKHATGIEIEGKKPQDVCGPCIKSHQRLNIGHHPMPQATRPLQIIHSDLGGPIQYTLVFEG